jgi:hypothetical protein
VFEAAGPNGQRFTLTEPWTLLLAGRRTRDPRVHAHPATLQAGGHRDTLVLTYRAGGFQGV